MAPTTSPLVSKIKVHLKLTISRLRIVQQKDQAIAKQQRRAMAQLLEQGKIASARIRVENIIRSDLLTELHEILELYCELLLARAGLLETTPCDPGLEEAVKSIIYAAPRVEVKELLQTRNLLAEKFGKEFAREAAENVKKEGGGEAIPERVTKKLRVEPPGEELVESYLKAIAAAYDVKYGSDDDDEGADDSGAPEEEAEDDEDDGEGGGMTEEPLTTDALESKQMSPPRDLTPKLPIGVVPPRPTTEDPMPKAGIAKVTGSGNNNDTKSKKTAPPVVKGKDTTAKNATQTNGNGKAGSGASETGAAGSKKKPEGEIPDADDLEARFRMLKR